eukprot:scaffold47_cov258-Pinguiococcus_pyrenoidosus.AAC.106
MEWPGGFGWVALRAANMVSGREWCGSSGMKMPAGGGRQAGTAFSGLLFLPSAGKLGSARERELSVLSDQLAHVLLKLGLLQLGVVHLARNGMVFHPKVVHEGHEAHVSRRLDLGKGEKWD